MTQRSGVTLVELIITVMIIAVMTAAATIYYNDVLAQTNKDKAYGDLRQLKKVLLQYQSTLPDQLTTYDEISQNVEMRDLRGLVELRLMPEVPPDPWGSEYKIDIVAGIVYSPGPNGTSEFDYNRYTYDPTHSPPLPMYVKDALLLKGDDIIVHFKPDFRADRAIIGPHNESVEVDFTRPVDYTYLTTDTSFIVKDSGTTVTVTTTVVDLLHRHKVRIKLESPLSQLGPWTVDIKYRDDPNNYGIFDGTVIAVDGAEIEEPTHLNVEMP